jgi:TatD DNase family protein
MQIDVFRRQIHLARRLELPRSSMTATPNQDILRILQAEGEPYRGVFHCFAGDEALAEQAMELAFT